MYKCGRLIVWVFCAVLCCGGFGRARADDACVETAKNMKLVTLSYNYGILAFDHSKTRAQVKKICQQSHAAGCFIHSFGSRQLTAARQAVKVGNTYCLMPHITVNYDFSGATVYVSKELDACPSRAVLRHELQHFTIWKKATEEMLRELGVKLKKLALNDVKECGSSKRCSSSIIEKADNLTTAITKKWEDYSNKNNGRLDEVDHDLNVEFAYRACESWPY